MQKFISRIAILTTLLLHQVGSLHAAQFENRVILKRESPGAFAIPKMTCTAQGVLVIVFQDRRGGDWGKRINPYVIRSVDGGKTWSKPIALLPNDFPLANESILKPTGLVANHLSGELITFVSRSPLKNSNGETVHERWFYANIKETRRLGRAWFQLVSIDDGESWSVPTDITQQLIKKPHWQEWSPVHTGLQLKRGAHAGRLVVPVRCYCPETDPSQHDLKFQTNSVIYSDDAGRTWIPGGRSEPRFGECSITELADGSICMNQRVSPGQPGFRWRAVSRDGGKTFEPTRKTNLSDQRCHAGICATEHNGKRLLLLSSVPGKQRKQLTLSISHDEGMTWDRKRVIHPGYAAYSDLVAMPNGTFACVYETGDTTSRRDLAVATFDLSWVMSER